MKEYKISTANIGFTLIFIILLFFTIGFGVKKIYYKENIISNQESKILYLESEIKRFQENDKKYFLEVEEIIKHKKEIMFTITIKADVNLFDFDKNQININKFYNKYKLTAVYENPFYLNENFVFYYKNIDPSMITEGGYFEVFSDCGASFGYERYAVFSILYNPEIDLFEVVHTNYFSNSIGFDRCGY